MPWSPPKKIIVQISFLLELLGLVLGVAGSGMFGLNILIYEYVPYASAMITDQMLGILGAAVCFLGWIVVISGVMFRHV